MLFRSCIAEWDRIYREFQAGEQDVLFQAQDTPERLEKFYFSKRLRYAAVSYTHLDVYKRQAWTRESWPWRGRLYVQGSSGSLTARTGILFNGEAYLTEKRIKRETHLKGIPAGKRKEGWQVKEYFSIGELAELFGLNIQTLYYYDSVGIFSPRERNEKNGRRKYEFDQIYELATVSYMRRLGSVSYTHLDVYKRQAESSPTRQRERRIRASPSRPSCRKSYRQAAW